VFEKNSVHLTCWNH